MTKRPAVLKVGEALGMWNTWRGVKDRELRRKRILDSSSYYPAVANPRTELVAEHIARMTPAGIVTADGTQRKADVIIFGTGFHIGDSYIYVEIKGSHGEDLVDRWNRGVAVAGVPNLFFLLGPNTGLGHNSMAFMIESRIRCSTNRLDRCGTPAAVAAGTSTSAAKARCCGAVTPGSTGMPPAGWSRPSTSSSGWAPAPGSQPMPTMTRDTSSCAAAACHPPGVVVFEA